MGSGNKRFTRMGSMLTVVIGVTGNAAATENFDLRYAPGFGGADMSAPIDPGWYFQMPSYSYKGKVKLNSTANVDLTAPPFNVPIPGASASTPVQTEIRVRISALAPRLTFMSTEQWLGATVGATALLPLIEKKADASAAAGQTTFNAAASLLPAANQTAIANGIGTAVAQQASALSSASFGVGDLELGPILRWNLDPAQVLFGLIFALPTGAYDKNRSTNPSAGNFYTVRPMVQYSHIGESWDLGVRAAYSINTRNRDTQYRSGDHLNVDFSLMKSLSEQLRVGAAGYAFLQTTRDTVNGTPTALQALTVGKKGRSFAIGPSLAWIKGTGDWLVEGRLLKEFSVQNRPEGTALWVSLTVPLR